MKVYFFTFLWFPCVFTFAQHGIYPTGARSEALGAAPITLGDPFSSINNIGSLARHEKTGVFTSYKTFWGLPGLRSVAAGFNFPLAGGMVGAHIFRFGDRLYNEQKIGLGFSHSIGRTSLGIQANYLQFQAEGSGSTGFMVIEFGGVAKLIKGLYVAGYCWNLAGYARDGLKVPVVLKYGMLYNPLPFFKLVFQLDHTPGSMQKTCYRVGMEYLISGIVYIRSGFRLPERIAAFGTGVRLNRMTIDYAVSLHGFLGASHELSLTYQINRK